MWWLSELFPCLFSARIWNKSAVIFNVCRVQLIRVSDIFASLCIHNLLLTMRRRLLFSPMQQSEGLAQNIICVSLALVASAPRSLWYLTPGESSLCIRARCDLRESIVWVSERERVFYLFIIRNNPSRNIKMQTTARWGEWRRAAVIKINELQTGFAYNTHTQRASVWRVVCARKAFSLCQCVHNGEYYCSTYRFMKNSCKMTTPPLWVTRTFSRKRRVHADADVHLPTCEHRKGNAFIKMGCRDEMIFVCFYSVKETWRPGKWGFATES